MVSVQGILGNDVLFCISVLCVCVCARQCGLSNVAVNVKWRSSVAGPRNLLVCRSCQLEAHLAPEPLIACCLPTARMLQGLGD